ncbi:MAG: T9SS type A sorting domain-containing protein [Ignavibacteriales bacterium]|nr:T9SS type A sorting domain-containing protein [Ignavibacteriales bacterium]
MPGKAYWVKTNQAGKLILSNSGFALRANKIQIIHTDELPPPAPDRGIVMELAIPKEYGLEQAYPNPFNPSTTIKYELPNDSRVSLKVYDLLGQVVAILRDGAEQAGYKSVDWNADFVSSGIYFYKLEVVSVTDPGKSFVQVKKMILMK